MSLFFKVTEKCNFKIQSLSSTHNFKTSCLVIPEITEPNFYINSKLNLPSDIQLADPTFYKLGKIDILLGANLFWESLKQKQNTVFGCIVTKSSIFGTWECLYRKSTVLRWKGMWKIFLIHFYT